MDIFLLSDLSFKPNQLETNRLIDFVHINPRGNESNNTMSLNSLTAITRSSTLTTTLPRLPIEGINIIYIYISFKEKNQRPVILGL